MSATLSLIVALSLGGPLPTAELPKAKYGYLWFYEPDEHGHLCKRVVPYEPRECDILFYDDQSKVWEYLYNFAGTTPPFHTGVLVKRPDGSPAVLESGPDDTLWVYIYEAAERLHTFKGILQVRQCKKVLSPEESQRLTAWAQAQDGKHYAMWRLLLQGTPIKTRGGPLRESLAYTVYDRKRWLCTEIVIAAVELVGVLDPKVYKASNIWPLDIVDDHNRCNIGHAYEPAAYWCPHP
jgi:hypothetical protein